MSKVLLRSQVDLLTDIRRRMRDASKAMWTDDEIYLVMGDALMDWRDRVAVPQLYTVTGGWVTGQADYDLPSYINDDLTPQQRRWTWSTSESERDNQWVDVLDFTVSPNTSGGLTLHLGRLPSTGDGRILWWGRNGRLPLVVPTLAADITSSATSATVTTSEDLPESGYIKIGSEWLGYAGVTRDATVTLSNLSRGVYGTTAASHTSGDNVAFGVAVHRDDLFVQLYNAVRAGLHEMYITGSAESERAHHERMTMYYRDLATAYWRGYTPNKVWNLKLGINRTAGGQRAEHVYSVVI